MSPACVWVMASGEIAAIRAPHFHQLSSVKNSRSRAKLRHDSQIMRDKQKGKA